MNRVKELLFENADEKYRDFQSSLIPAVDKDTIMGVRVPDVRKIAKDLAKNYPQDVQTFLNDLPHKYYDENILHAVLISDISDFDTAMEYTEQFLPYIDNWAVCDILNPRAFKTHKTELWRKIETWLNSSNTYIVRFAIVSAMRHFLDNDFSKDKFDAVIKVMSDDYYVNMAIAWYMSFALVKQYDVAVKIIEGNELPISVHNKSIQKAVESYRVSDDKKQYLKTFRKHD